MLPLPSALVWMLPQLPRRRVRGISGAPVELIPVIVMTGAGTSPGRVGEEAVEGEKCEHKKI